MSTRRFARVRQRGEARWLELVDDGSARLLAGSPTDAPLVYAGELSSAEALACTHLAPCEPGKILGLGRNYKSLVGNSEVYEEPVFFLKSPTSLCGPDSQVAYPDFATKVWVEVELGIVIGHECRAATVDEARRCILGHTVSSDITAENIHGRDWHLARSKAIDGFAPTGPWLVQHLDTSSLAMESRINGRVAQSGNTNDRIQDDAEIVSCLSRYLTLRPWDLILTGTPAGAVDAVVAPGDVVTHRIDGLGELRFTIADRQ